MKRFAVALMATTVLASGCQKSTTASPELNTVSPDLNMVETNSIGVVATPNASAPVVTVEKLAKITLPVPKGAPANGRWEEVTSLEDGDRSENYMVGEALWVSLRILDCNAPKVKEGINKPADQRGDFTFCLNTNPPPGKLGAYGLYSPGPSVRVLMPGHLSIITGVGAEAEGKLTGADLEAFLTSLDPDALARL